MTNNGNLIKNIFSYAGQEIRKRMNTRKDFTSTGITSHDLNYMYDIYTREFSGVTSDNMLQYIDFARRGAPFYFYKFAESIIKRDTRIRTMVRKLKAAILQEQYIITGDWKEGNKFVEDVIKNLGSGLYKFLTSSTDANIFGLKRFEINYDIVKGNWIPSRIRPIPNALYMYDEMTDEYSFLDVTKTDNIRLRTILTAHPDKIDISLIPKQETNPLKILDVFAIDGDSENAFMDGVLIALFFAYYCKSYNVKDMNIFLERYASPTMKMKYDSLNSGTKEELQKASKEMKVHGTIIYPDGTEVDLMNDSQKGAAGNLYLNAINYWNSEVTILLAGEEETTQMGSKGSLAALKVKERISDLIIQMNLMTCANAMNDLIKRIIDVNFENPPEYPKFSYIKISTLQDKLTQSTINMNLKAIGYLPTQDVLEEQFGVELEPATDPAADPAEANDDNENKAGDEETENPDDSEFEINFLEDLYKQAEREATV